MLRNVIITGAGAVLPWGAVGTKKITDYLIKDKIFVNDRFLSIGSYLYNLLMQNAYYKTTQPNFETLLNFVETIYQSKLPKLSNDLSNFDFTDYFILNDKITKTLSSFELYNPNIKKDINSSGLLDTSFGKNRPILNERYYYELYLHYIFKIIEKIKLYDNIKNINQAKYKQINSHFCKFLQKLKENGIVRYYTVNYDYLPTKISPFKFFDGYNSNGKLDTYKIVNSLDIDCYFHLHGSHELNFIGEKSNNYRGTKCAFDFRRNELIFSNIITGYNKLDRIQSESFRHFNNQLLFDCNKADTLYIVGYSFGDTHINNAINVAMQKKTKIIVIDYFENADEDSIDLFKQKYYRIQPLPEYDIADMERNKFIFKKNRVEIYFKGFESYLSNKFASPV
ncbi:MAG: SIR2 family protein [Bacteroidetes bacterium]|nr:SIR2 family protein [Bacteroidota bacterium]